MFYCLLCNKIQYKVRNSKQNFVKDKITQSIYISLRSMCSSDMERTRWHRGKKWQLTPPEPSSNETSTVAHTTSRRSVTRRLFDQLWNMLLQCGILPLPVTSEQVQRRAARFVTSRWATPGTTAQQPCLLSLDVSP